MVQIPDIESLMTPAEVAMLFRVDPKTVTRWAKTGKLTSIRTLGGHHRYREAEVRAALRAPTNHPPGSNVQVRAPDASGRNPD